MSQEPCALECTNVFTFETKQTSEMDASLPPMPDLESVDDIKAVNPEPVKVEGTAQVIVEGGKGSEPVKVEDDDDLPKIPVESKRRKKRVIADDDDESESVPKAKRSTKTKSRSKTTKKSNTRTKNTKKQTKTSRKPKPKRRSRLVDDEAEPDSSDLEVDERSEDEESIGSLKDFIVENEEDVVAEIKQSREIEKQKENDPLDGIDTSNIISGKRTRRAPTRYVDPDYWNLMTQDMDEEEVAEFVNEVVKEEKEPEPVEEDDTEFTEESEEEVEEVEEDEEDDVVEDSDYTDQTE